SPLLGTKRREKPADRRLFSFTAQLATRFSRAPRERACPRMQRSILRHSRASPLPQTVAPTTSMTPAANCSAGKARSGAKRMTAQDGFVALGAGRDHIDRDLADFLDAMQVGACLLRQRVPALRAEGRAAPALHGLVDRLAACDLFRTHGQQVD